MKKSIKVIGLGARIACLGFVLCFANYMGAHAASDQMTPDIAIAKIVKKLEKKPASRNLLPLLLGQAAPASSEEFTALTQLWQTLSKQDQETLLWVNPGINQVIEAKDGVQIPSESETIRTTSYTNNLPASSTYDALNHGTNNHLQSDAGVNQASRPSSLRSDGISPGYSNATNGEAPCCGGCGKEKAPSASGNDNPHNNTKSSGDPSKDQLTENAKKLKAEDDPKKIDDDPLAPPTNPASSDAKEAKVETETKAVAKAIDNQKQVVAADTAGSKKPCCSDHDEKDWSLDMAHYAKEAERLEKEATAKAEAEKQVRSALIRFAKADEDKRALDISNNKSLTKNEKDDIEKKKDDINREVRESRKNFFASVENLSQFSSVSPEFVELVVKHKEIQDIKKIDSKKAPLSPEEQQMINRENEIRNAYNTEIKKAIARQRQEIQNAKDQANIGKNQGGAGAEFDSGEGGASFDRSLPQSSQNQDLSPSDYGRDHASEPVAMSPNARDPNPNLSSSGREPRSSSNGSNGGYNGGGNSNSGGRAAGPTAEPATRGTSSGAPAGGGSSGGAGGKAADSPSAGGGHQAEPAPGR